MGKMEKISAWNLTKVRSKSEVIDEARTSGAKVHFASLMDICHLKKQKRHHGRAEKFYPSGKSECGGRE